MPPRPLRIAVTAEESVGIRLLRSIVGAGHELVAVAASDATGPGRTSSVWDVAGTLGAPRASVASLLDGSFARRIRERSTDLLLNVHSLVVLPEEVIEAPTLGAYNLHPGPLPEMAGRNVASWAIFEGRARHGVTVHRMERGIDTGAIAYERAFDIGPAETALSLMGTCIGVGLELVRGLIADAAGGRPIPAMAQDLSRRRYYAQGPPNAGWIEWTWPATRIAALVRACDFGPFRSPWGRAGTESGGLRVEVVSADALEGPAVGGGAQVPGLVRHSGAEGVIVGSGEGNVRVRRVLVDGEVVEPASAFRAGEVLGRQGGASASEPG